MDTYFFSIFSVSFVFYGTVNFSKDGIVSSHTDVIAMMDSGAQLSDQDVSCFYDLVAKAFDSASLRITVSSIS